MWFKYLFGKHLFLSGVIFTALTLFYVGVDLMINIHSLPPSSNLQLLYMAWMTIVALKLTLPLALIFGVLGTLASMLRTSELSALLALGLSRKKLFWPFAAVSMIGALLLIGVYATKFGYANQNARMILNERYLEAKTTDLFFRYNESYVYFGLLNQFKKSAENVRVFVVSDQHLQTLIKAQKAHYDSKADHWVLENVEALQLTASKEPVRRFNLPHIEMLEGFRPKLLDTINNPKGNFSITDALAGLQVLTEQGINTRPLRSAVYELTVMPLLAPLIVGFIVLAFPTSARFVNIPLFSAKVVMGVLGLWGLFMILVQLGRGSVFWPELLICLPFLLLGALLWRLYRRAL